MGRDQASGGSVLEKGCKGKLLTGRGRPKLQGNGSGEAGGGGGLSGSQVDKMWQEVPQQMAKAGRREGQRVGLRLHLPSVPETSDWRHTQR